MNSKPKADMIIRAFEGLGTGAAGRPCERFVRENGCQASRFCDKLPVANIQIVPV